MLDKMLSIIALFFCIYFSFTTAATSRCSSGVVFIKEPQSLLPCYPSTTIGMLCEISRENETILWHYFGLNMSSSILINSLSISSYYSVFVVGGVSTLSFMVNPSTYGVYWCTVEGYTTPSTATIICPSTIDPSLENCGGVIQSNDSDKCVYSNETSSYPFNISSVFDQCVPPPGSSSSALPIVNVTLPTTTQTSTSTNTAPLVSVASTLMSPSLVTLLTSIAVTRSVSHVVSVPSYTITLTSNPVTRVSSKISSSLSQMSPSSSLPPLLDSNRDVEGPNPILIVLTIVCVLLGCVATLIITAIVILCCLTRSGKYADKEDGSIPPTVDPIRYTDDIHEADGVSRSTCTTTNSSPPLQPPEDQPISFSNPVYEMAIPKLATPTASQMSLNPPKHLPPQSSSPTPPIFSEDKSDEKRRSYYTKPDLSKKRSQSITARELSQPPIKEPTGDHEVMYDIPTVVTSTKAANNDATYTSPNHIIKPTTTAKEATPKGTSEPNYEAPWEKLPIAVQRSRESTRSRSRQPDPLAQPTNINNNNTAALFDDPAYDIPSV